MGLDSIQVIMATEEAFDIEIRDRDAERIGTVRELALFVARRVPRQSGRECRTQRAFYQVRRVLQRLRIPRTQVTQSADLLALKPILAHPEVWPQLGKALGASRWPPLSRKKTGLPYGLRTPGELARHLATGQLEKTQGPWTGEEVLLRVREVVSIELEIISFPDDAHFVNDLGVG